MCPIPEWPILTMSLVFVLLERRGKGPLISRKKAEQGSQVATAWQWSHSGRSLQAKSLRGLPIIRGSVTNQAGWLTVPFCPITFLPTQNSCLSGIKLLRPVVTASMSSTTQSHKTFLMLHLSYSRRISIISVIPIQK